MNLTSIDIGRLSVVYSTTEKIFEILYRDSIFVATNKVFDSKDDAIDEALRINRQPWRKW